MDKTRRFFISDVHMGVGQKAWFDAPKHRPNLLAFLRWVAEQQDAKDLVLLGDLFDTWMIRMEDEPPSVRKIAELHGEVIEAIKRCSASIENVFYLNGNHDMHVEQDDLDVIFGAGVVHKIPRYNGGLLYAEHGNRFAMFNAPDSLHDPAMGFPLGYFITRLLASSKAEYDSPASVATYVDDLLEAAFTTATIAESVIEALMEVAGKRPTDTFKMPDGRRELTIAEVKTKYANLFPRWVEKFGQQYAIQAIRGEMGSLGWFADRLCKSNGFRVVVLGHTHRAEVDKDSLFVKKDRIYANAGYWCTDRPTFVEVDKRDGRLIVRLWSRTGEGMVEIGKAVSVGD